MSLSRKFNNLAGAAAYAEEAELRHAAGFRGLQGLSSEAAAFILIAAIGLIIMTYGLALIPIIGGAKAYEMFVNTRARANRRAFEQRVAEAQDRIGAQLSEFAASAALQSAGPRAWDGRIDGLQIRIRWVEEDEIPVLWRAGEVVRDNISDPPGWTVEIQPNCLADSRAGIALPIPAHLREAMAPFGPKGLDLQYHFWGDVTVLTRLLLTKDRKPVDSLLSVGARILGPSIVLDPARLARVEDIPALVSAALDGAGALQAVHEADHVPRLLALLRSNTTIERRVDAIIGLAAEQGAEAGAAVFDALDASDDRVALAAISVYSGPDVAPLVAAASDPSRNSALRTVALCRLLEKGAKGTAVAEATRTGWLSSTLVERVASLQLAGALRMPEFGGWFATLEASGRDDHSDVNLIGLVPPMRFERLPRLFRELQARPVAAGLSRAMKHFATTEHTPTLLAASRHPIAEVRMAAIDALGRVGTLVEIAPRMAAVELGPREDNSAEGAEQHDVPGSAVQMAAAMRSGSKKAEKELAESAVAQIQSRHGGGEAGAVAVVSAATAGSVALATPVLDGSVAVATTQTGETPMESKMNREAGGAR